MYSFMIIVYYFWRWKLCTGPIQHRCQL